MTKIFSCLIRRMMVNRYTIYQKRIVFLNTDRKAKLDKIKFYQERWSKKMTHAISAFGSWLVVLRSYKQSREYHFDLIILQGNFHRNQLFLFADNGE